MKLSNFAAYIAQLWRNKPDTSTPLSAERLRHIEDGIKGNSDAIEAIAAAVVNQIVNDPDKIASMAALYAVNQKVSALDGKVGDTAQLPDGATDVVTAIAKQNSDFFNRIDATKISLLTQPSGTTIRQKIENCQKGTLYSWAHNPSELYNPTGKNGTWSFLIVRADKEMYTICLACEGGSKLYIYSYNANAWYGMDGTIVRQFN